MTSSHLAAQGGSPPSAAIRTTIAALVAVLTLSAGLNFWNIDFPLGYHADEPTKVSFIKSGTQNFRHPILILQLGRALSAFAGRPADDQQIGLLGRSITALCAVGIVLVSYILARRVLRTLSALAVAAAIAVSPVLVVYAHYLKEDVLLTLCLMLFLLALAHFVDHPGRGASTWLGITAGLAFSSHYKSILLVVLLALAAVFGVLSEPTEPRGIRIRGPMFYRHLAWAGVIAATVFLLVNWPLVHDVNGFLNGVRYEARHAALGDEVNFRALDFWLGFHLRYSLAPGMTWPALATCVLGLLWSLLRWHRAVSADRLLVLYVGVFYFVPELFPLKDMRYIIPVVPALIYFGWRVVEHGCDTLPRPCQSALFAAAIVGLIVCPLGKSVRLVASMGDDTRARAERWLREHEGKTLVEEYAGLAPDVGSASTIDVARARKASATLSRAASSTTITSSAANSATNRPKSTALTNVTSNCSSCLTSRLARSSRALASITPRSGLWTFVTLTDAGTMPEIRMRS